MRRELTPSGRRARIDDQVILADTLFHPPRPDEPPIVTPLQQALYQQFYCPLPDSPAGDADPSEGAGDANRFLERLRAANRGRERVSPEWALHATSPEGRFVVFNGEVVHVADPADVTHGAGEDGKSNGLAAVRFAVNFDRRRPLFARPLAPGLGLADDPGNGESFGQHRMRLVARALTRAGASAPTVAQKRLRVADEFAALGLNLERPHLNAGAANLPVTFARAERQR